ncbi:Chitin synthase, class 7 [Epichloe bromicola]|uniref:Chitin synthase, class 7 n=1 Tax=Epichloe bromicola TaxID=79588 RepID=A0ABQ0CIJ4_9HYPO
MPEKDMDVFQQSGLHRALVRARKEGAFIDYELECEGTKIPVHKSVICSQSKVFMAACTGPFKESEGTYHVKDFSLIQVQCMIDFLYTGTYAVPKPPKPNDKWGTDDPVLHAVMFAMGDKYLINDLKNCAKSFYRSSLYHHATDVESFLQSVREIYTRTTDELQHGRELRRAAIKAGLQKFGTAMVSEACKSLCDDVLRECPAFGTDILAPLMKKTEDERLGRRCHFCGIAHPPEDYMTPLPCSGSRDSGEFGSPKTNYAMRFN